MIRLIENDITVDEYLATRRQVGWRELSVEQATKAIENSLYFVKAVSDDGNIVGIGRIVGDGAVISYVQDLIVVPDMQKEGIGSLILDRLKQYVVSISEEGSTMMFCLMCAKGREPFYEKHGFMVRPNENLGPGMIQFIRK